MARVVGGNTGGEHLIQNRSERGRRVCRQQDDAPWLRERELIEELPLPLNLDGRPACVGAYSPDLFGFLRSGGSGFKLPKILESHGYALHFFNPLASFQLSKSPGDRRYLIQGLTIGVVKE